MKMAQIHALTPEGRLPTAAVAHVQEIAVPRTTGWRDVTAWASGRVSGRLLIKRTDLTTTLVLDELVVSGTGTTGFTRLPHEFWPIARVRETWHSDLANDPVGTLNISPTGYFRLYNVLANTTMHGRFQWDHTDGRPFPTTNPGTPA